MLVGNEISSVDTPVLWVDLDLMENNITSMANHFNQVSISWRPHVKSIKVPAVAHMLLNAGAIGVACAKLGEAEVMAAAGIKDILIANQVASPQKIKRLVALQHHSDVMVAVDNPGNAEEISSQAIHWGVRVRVLIEVNTGMGRCGVEPGKPVLDLARQVVRMPGIELAGVMTWEGGRIAKISDIEEKGRQSRLALEPFVESAQLCREAGIDMPILSCGGSGTYMVSSKVPGVTEMQAGGAVFGSIAYREWGVNLDCALFVTSTVISRSSPNRAVVDAGRKAMNIEVAIPEVINVDGVEIAALHAEHGLLELKDSDSKLAPGDRIDFIVGYGDYTVNLYDRIYAVRRGVIEAIWEITARGKIT